MAGRTRSFLDERREALAASERDYNGIAGVEVDPADPTRLTVRFVKPLPGETDGVPADPIGPADLTIAGGDRIRGLGVTAVSASGDELTVRINREGDFSTYVLAIDPDRPGYDPMLREIAFRFRVQCDAGLDCEAPDVVPAAPGAEPRLDYLARDYDSYRRFILDRLSLTTPAMVERNPASLEITLVELLAYLGDQLSYKLDQVATEYSLETARLRTSAARHARLVGYRMHNGVSARVLAQVEVSAPIASLARGEVAFLTRDAELGGDVVSREDAGPATARGALVFEPAHEMTLVPAHNRIGLHHWGDPDAVLARGATEAWLRDPDRTIALRAGDILILAEERDPDTGRAADADPAHRQAVRLIRDPEAVLDPLEEVTPGTLLQALRVVWGDEDALGFALAVGERPPGAGDLAAAYGNVVVADHGMTLTDPERLGVAPSMVDPELPPAPGQPDELKPLALLDRPAAFAPTLRHRDLTFTAGSFRTLEPHAPAARIARLDPSRAVADIRLSTPGEADDWEPLSDLLGAGPDDRVFVPEVEADGATQLRFGRGHDGAASTRGKTPVAGSALFARYRVGAGGAGNIGADSLAHIAASGVAAPNVVRVRNPLPAGGGLDRETIREVRQRAPVSFYERRRAVTLADYEALLNAHPDVQRAHARKRWLGSWSAIFLSVDRVGSLEVDDAFRAAMLAYLEPFRMMGHDLTIDAPIYAPLEIGLRACVGREYFAEDVKAALEDRFASGLRADGQRGFFHPDNITFASTVYLSRIYEAALQVAGVDDIHVTKFQRAGATGGAAAADAGVLTFGPREIPVLSNDPNRPDAGSLTVETEGGR